MNGAVTSSSKPSPGISVPALPPARPCQTPTELLHPAARLPSSRVDLAADSLVFKCFMPVSASTSGGGFEGCEGPAVRQGSASGTRSELSAPFVEVWGCLP